MVDDNSSGSGDGAVLSQALKAIRRHRGMTPRETAHAMNMAPRTYQRFEAGDTRINLNHIHRFAAATRSDPHAILTAVAIGSPDHALRSCDNRLDTILMIGVKNLDDALGDRLRELETRAIIEAVIMMCDTLAETLVSPDPVSLWLADGTQDLVARRPKPGQ